MAPPWSGRQVHVHEVIEKHDVVAFRCSLSGRSSHRWLGGPAWMFDRAASSNWRSTTVPRVDLAVLGALARLLHDTRTSSQPQGIGNPRAVETDQIPLWLMVRLILDHLNGDRAVQREGVDQDA